MTLPFVDRAFKWVKRLLAPVILSCALLFGGDNPVKPPANKKANDRYKGIPEAFFSSVSEKKTFFFHRLDDDSTYSPFSTDDEPELDSLGQLNKKRQEYAMHLFQDSVNTKNPKAPFYYPRRYDRDFPDAYTAASQLESEVDPRVRDLWNNLQRLKDTSMILGPKIADFSVRGKVIYTNDNRAGGVYGAWKKKKGIIRINNNVFFSSDFKMLIQVHETIHGIQESNERFARNVKMSVYDCQASLLSYEAAAVAGSYLVALEFYLKGEKGLWEEMKKINPDMCEDILEAWEEERYENGLTQIDALRKVGEFAFKRQFFEEQEWMNGYNTTILNFYMRLLAEDGIKKGYVGGLFTQADLSQLGYISPEFNFTSKMGLAALAENLCGDNNRMAEAMDYIEMMRIRGAYGRDSREYKLARRNLKEDGNPYVNLDPKEIYECYLYLNKVQSVLWVMDTLADGVDIKKEYTKQSLNLPLNNP